VLPLIGDKDLSVQLRSLINKVKDIESRLSGPIDYNFWQGLNEPIDKLIGSIENSESGLIIKVVSSLLAQNIPSYSQSD